MISLANLNSFVPPVPITPVPPNFAYCNEAYGVGLKHDEAMHAGALLKANALPVTYSVEGEEMDRLAANISVPQPGYHLPSIYFYGDIAITVDVSGPIHINEISVVPNDIRGMAAYVANQCVGRRGVGGFVTRKIQGLVDFVTDPNSDLDTMQYPDSTAFLTLMVSDIETSGSFPGDYDPQMANFLWKAELDVYDRVIWYDHVEIAKRIQRFAQVQARMQRLGTDIAWWSAQLMHGNRTGVTGIQLANMTSEGVTTARRRRRVAGLLR